MRVMQIVCGRFHEKGRSEFLEGIWRALQSFKEYVLMVTRIPGH
jgi:hypothetical protein